MDVLIRNAKIIDGTGNPYFWGDVGLENGKIAAIGKIEADAELTIDAKGLAVAPGFIDIHTHADVMAFHKREMKNWVTQGVTTATLGHCSYSPFPDSETFFALAATHPASSTCWYSNKWPFMEKWSCYSEYLQLVNEKGMAIDLAPFIGHGSIRWKLGLQDKALPSQEQLEAMKSMVRKGMSEGAVGLSFGSDYPPSMFGEENEIIELTRVVGEYDGIIAWHLPSMATVSSVQLAVRIARTTGVPVHIPHLNPYPNKLGTMSEMLDTIDSARREGLDITFDVMQFPNVPFCPETMAGIVHMVANLYGGLNESWETFAQHMQDAEFRHRIAGIVIKDEATDDIFLEVVRSFTKAVLMLTGNPKIEDRTVAEIANELGADAKTLTIDLIFGFSELIPKGQHFMFVPTVFGSEESIAAASSHPAGMAGSDLTVNITDQNTIMATPNPHGYSTMPKFFRNLVDRGMRIEEAVRKMTSFPARTLRLQDRGLLQEGMRADIVIFDPEQYAPGATVINPVVPAKGIYHVIVNGVPVLLDSVATGNRPGRIINK
ncbi:MAG: amidohydrolase family protein [Dehalobacterium sp.]